MQSLKLKQINTVSSVRRRQEEQRKEDAKAEAEGRARVVTPGSELADKAEAHTKNREEIPAEIMVELLALRVAEADASEGDSPYHERLNTREREYLTGVWN